MAQSVTPLDVLGRTQEAQEPHLFSAKKQKSLDKLTDDEKLERRKERLVGRTVKGVLIRNRQNFAVKWNDCQFDNVYVSQRSVALSLGPRPARGIVAVVRCQIKTMGPTSAPWYLQHPYTDKLDLVTRYMRKRQTSRRWVHSGMTWHTGTPFTDSPSYSNAASLPPSKQPTPVGSRRASVVDLENPPAGSRIVTRRGSSFFIDHGKRWEYKPPVSGPQQLPMGWSMRAVRFNGATYFVPSPPRPRRSQTQRQSGYDKRRSRGGRRSAKGGPRQPSKRKDRRTPRSKRNKPQQPRPSEEDRLKAEKLIKLIEAQEKRESERKEAKPRSKGKGRKKPGKQKQQPASAEKAPPKQSKKRARRKKGAGKTKRQSQLQKATQVSQAGVEAVEA